MKRLIKKFYAIASCVSEDIDSTYAQFILELDSQDTVASLKSKSNSVAHEEITTYEAQIHKIQEETTESERLIAELKQELAAAQQSRRNKIIYDSIAKEALKLPSRATSAETIQRLTAELKDLEAEQQKYAITWARRQEAFGAIVSSLEELGERVKEEKSEQERKEALRDGDDDMGETATAPATPKPGEESSAEDTDSGLEIVKKKKTNLNGLDPNAPTFEPSPLRQEQIAFPTEDGEKPDGMELDEDTVQENRKPRSRTTSTREEGEEEEEEGKDEATAS